MYKIVISKKAEKQIKLISKLHLQQALNEIFLEIKEDPLVGKLLGEELTNRYSYRVGVYRILYLINFKDKKVIILSAKHRSVVYK
ncbi:type II toxin-antitoxin system RelE/ParE family toxin [Candidatus Daviesbacteria bacterium]|nr:type II toxin-antitoxin system RelE/ParE family toxin [Candidatus Daviesbacteria bacterium]